MVEYGYRGLLRRVRLSYTPEKRQEDLESGPVIYWFYRPVSFLVTPLFMSAGLSANQATLLGIAAALAMPGAAQWAPAGYCWVAGLALFYHIMDHVDGNLARTTGISTVAGALLERLHALIFWPMYFVSVGLLVPPDGLAIGLGAAVFLLLKREVQDAFEATYPSQDVQWGPRTQSRQAGQMFFNLGYLLEHTTMTVGLVLAGHGGWLDRFLIGIPLYLAGVFAAWLPKLLRVVRQSERAIPPARQ